MAALAATPCSLALCSGSYAVLGAPEKAGKPSNNVPSGTSPRAMTSPRDSRWPSHDWVDPLKGPHVSIFDCRHALPSPRLCRGGLWHGIVFDAGGGVLHTSRVRPDRMCMRRTRTASRRWTGPPRRLKARPKPKPKSSAPPVASSARPSPEQTGQASRPGRPHNARPRRTAPRLITVRGGLRQSADPAEVRG